MDTEVQIDDALAVARSKAEVLKLAVIGLADARPDFARQLLSTAVAADDLLAVIDRAVQINAEEQSAPALPDDGPEPTETGLHDYERTH